MAKHTQCPVCREEHEPRSLTYDGRGVNSCGMYRERIATIPDAYSHLGPTFAAALELRETCKALHDALSDILEDCASADRIGEVQHVHGNEYEIGRDHRARAHMAIRKSFKALAKAEGK